METLELKAPDISCGHCVNAIRKAVTRLGGVELVDADIPAGTVRLRYEPGPGQQVRDRASVGRSWLPGRRLNRWRGTTRREPRRHCRRVRSRQ